MKKLRNGAIIANILDIVDRLLVESRVGTSVGGFPTTGMVELLVGNCVDRIDGRLVGPRIGAFVGGFGTAVMV